MRVDLYMDYYDNILSFLYRKTNKNIKLRSLLRSAFEEKIMDFQLLAEEDTRMLKRVLLR